MTDRVLYLDSFAGVAGDMFTAAFLDAGLVDESDIRDIPRQLAREEVQVVIQATDRAQARVTSVRVVPPEDVEGPDHHHMGPDPHHHHHHYHDLVRMIQESELDPVARAFALRVFRLLGEAEADAHGVSLADVAFHEVGAIDSVVDVAMAGVCIAAVSPDRILASPVKLGRGTIRIHHGTYPVPPPASARLAQGMPVDPVPDGIMKPDVELSTPTGLAILRALEPEFTRGWPGGILVAQGSGAGTTDLGAYPNVFRVALLEGTVADGSVGSPVRGIPDLSLPYESDRVAELRCNVDDQTGEKTAWIMEKGLEMGALDGWVTQALGKKGRPATCMTFLTRPGDVGPLSDFLLRHSSTFGVRYALWDRLKLARTEELRDTSAGPISFKIGTTTNGEVLKEKPEFEDLRRTWEVGEGGSS